MQGCAAAAGAGGGAGAGASLHMAQAERIARNTRNALVLHVEMLMQVQAARLQTKLELHNPLMPQAQREQLPVDAIRMATTSDLALQSLRLAAQAVATPALRAEEGALPAATCTLGLREDTVLRVLLLDLHSTIDVLNADGPNEERAAKLEAIMVRKIRTLERSLLANFDDAQQDAWKSHAVLRWMPTWRGESAPQWRCTCPLCEAWACCTPAAWHDFVQTAAACQGWYAKMRTTVAQVERAARAVATMPPEALRAMTEQAARHLQTDSAASALAAFEAQVAKWQHAPQQDAPAP